MAVPENQQFVQHRSMNVEHHADEHHVAEMVAQRVYGLVLGYEDLNDHEELRNDPLRAVRVEKADPLEAETEDFLGFTHGQSPGWHSVSPVIQIGEIARLL
jgi:DDE family transposase